MNLIMASFFYVLPYLQLLNANVVKKVETKQSHVLFYLDSVSSVLMGLLFCALLTECKADKSLCVSILAFTQ